MKGQSDFWRFMAVVILSVLLGAWVAYFLPKIEKISFDNPSEPLNEPNEYARNLQKNIQTVLEKAVGNTPMEIMVNADVQMTEETIRKETIIPNSAALADYSFSDTLEEQENKPLNETKSYRVSSENVLVSKIYPKVNQIKVHILIDGKIGENRYGKKVYYPRTDQEMKLYSDLVKSVIGYDEKRGDVIDIVNLRFEKKPLTWFHKVSSTILIQSFLLALFFTFTFILIIRFIFPAFFQLMKENDFEKPTVPFSISKSNLQKTELNDFHPLRIYFKNQFQTALAGIKNWLYQTEKENGENYSKLEKASILLLSMGENVIKNVLLHLPEENVHSLSRTMARITSIPQEEVAKIVQEFTDYLNGKLPLSGSVQQVLNLLKDTFSDQKALHILSDIPREASLWEKMVQIETKDLLPLISQEYSQTIAVILYHLPPKKAADILDKLDENLKIDVLMRLNNLSSVDEMTLKALEASLENQINRLADRQKTASGHEKITDILSAMGRDQEAPLLQTLFERSPELASSLKEHIFNFDTLSSWAHDDLKQLISKAKTEILLLALKGASEELKEKISKLFSPKEWGEMLKKIEHLGAVKIKDIDEAQHQIVELALNHRNQNKWL